MDRENVWKVPCLLDLTHEPVTDDQIDTAERTLGVRLPHAYLAIIRQLNGGILRGKFPAMPGNSVWGVGPYSVPGPRTILRPWHWQDVPSSQHPEGKEWLVPFDGDGHWYLCLDYRRGGPTEEPAVCLLRGAWSRSVASSFQKYLDGVKVSRIPGRRIYGPESFDEIVATLCTALGGVPVHFDSHYAYGFRMVTLQLPGDGDGKHEWVGISSNRTPTWWKRLPGEAAELSLDYALRLPEEPDCVALVTNSPVVTKALKQTTLKTRR